MVNLQEYIDKKAGELLKNLKGVVRKSYEKSLTNYDELERFAMNATRLGGDCSRDLIGGERLINLFL